MIGYFSEMKNVFVKKQPNLTAGLLKGK